ncbi:hypothetical protein ACSBR2_033308 [Camellia fascicularis]
MGNKPAKEEKEEIFLKIVPPLDRAYVRWLARDLERIHRFTPRNPRAVKPPDHYIEYMRLNGWLDLDLDDPDLAHLLKCFNFLVSPFDCLQDEIVESGRYNLIGKALMSVKVSFSNIANVLLDWDDVHNDDFFANWRPEESTIHFTCVVINQEACVCCAVGFMKISKKRCGYSCVNCGLIRRTRYNPFEYVTISSYIDIGAYC